MVLIISILAGVAFPQYQKAESKARVTNFLGEVRDIRRAIDLYYMEKGSYPTRLDEISGGWKEGVSSDGSLRACFSSKQDECWEQISGYVRRSIKLPYIGSPNAWTCDLHLNPRTRAFCYVYTDEGEALAKSLGREKRQTTGFPSYYIPVEN